MRHLQQSGRAQSPLSSAFSIIKLLGNFPVLDHKGACLLGKVLVGFPWKAAGLCCPVH